MGSQGPNLSEPFGSLKRIIYPQEEDGNPHSPLWGILARVVRKFSPKMKSLADLCYLFSLISGKMTGATETDP